MGSSKEPDFSVTPKSATFPTLVVESGWSESFPRLRRDKDLWIHGGGGKIQLVLLIKWSSLSGGRVSGLIEVWAGDAMANDQLVQTEVIANLPGILLIKLATDSYRSSSPPLPPQSPRSSLSR